MSKFQSSVCKIIVAQFLLIASTPTFADSVPSPPAGSKAAYENILRLAETLKGTWEGSSVHGEYTYHETIKVGTFGQQSDYLMKLRSTCATMKKTSSNKCSADQTSNELSILTYDSISQRFNIYSPSYYSRLHSLTDNQIEPLEIQFSGKNNVTIQHAKDGGLMIVTKVHGHLWTSEIKKIGEKDEPAVGLKTLTRTNSQNPWGH